ncbi:class I SAM-dependent methyltransferase [Dactylosporangium sp. NPDC049140]|uniref:class I SAM-dependent methyltransferase n=1 Tax=Dactylosporangium sp. NPDC049140 TaxID=3155647 RepID=UPI0033E4B3F0
MQHDFACGTGRAIKLLHGVVRAAHGYDSSEQMLAKAREAGVYAKLHQVSEDGPVPEPATVDGPALVTVFRLLLNAPKDVRDRAIAFAARILQAGDDRRVRHRPQLGQRPAGRVAAGRLGHVQGEPADPRGALLRDAYYRPMTASRP